MTEKQVKTLRNGDKVRLPFSINPEQIIVDIVEKTGMITTSPEDDERAFYVNNYQDLEFVEKPVSTQSKEKSLILEMFTKFRKDGCDKCPFRIECDNTYSEIRMSTTDAFTICEALTMER